MTKVLRVDSSARHEASKTRDLADLVIEQLGDVEVVERDVSDGAIPVVNDTWTVAAYTDPSERTPAQKASLEVSDELVAELKAADTLVIAAPVYNFTVPASLKLWIDQVARAGVTFKYTESGPEGLLENKRAIIVVATGGTQVGSDADFQTPYLKHFLAFLGITDVEIYAADGLMGPQAEDTLKKTKAKIRELEPA